MTRVRVLLAPLCLTAGVLLGVLAACSPGSNGLTRTDGAPQSSEPAEIKSPQGRILITGGGQKFPSSCRPESVAQLLAGFFEDFNDGNATRLGSYFSPAPNFKWYSVSEGDPAKSGKHYVTYKPEDLPAYFNQRHETNEHLQLNEVAIRYDPAGNLGHISYVLSREADDLERPQNGRARVTEGKGAINCADGRIVLWSMATGPVGSSQGSRRVCPQPPSSEEPYAAIACVVGGQ